jgi:hypothetical protein
MVKIVIKGLLSLLLASLIAWTVLPIVPSWADSTSQVTIAQGQEITVKGKVKFIDVESGCYQLLTTDNIRYELQGEFPKQDGLIVKVSGTLITDLATLCQVGRPLQVKNIQVLRNH